MALEVQVIDTDYSIEDGEVYVRCFGKTSGGRNVVFYDRDFLPYLYAVPAEGVSVEELEKEVRETDFENDDEPLPVRKLEIEGRTRYNDYFGRLEIIVNEISDVDVEQEIESLVELMEA